LQHKLKGSCPWCAVSESRDANMSLFPVMVLMQVAAAWTIAAHGMVHAAALNATTVR
jgi:hypothetical protein